MDRINSCLYFALCASLVLASVVVDARSGSGSRSEDDIDYDDVELPPLNFEPASTPRPLSFKVPKVEHSKPDLTLDNSKPESSDSSTKWLKCATGIVTCCDWYNPGTCFDLRVFGCPGPFFDDPCSSEYYDAAHRVLKKYRNS